MKVRGKEEFAGKKLAWVAYIGGKRESRRLLGDIILREQDLLERVPTKMRPLLPPGVCDLHYPKPIAGMEEEPFSFLL